MVDVHSGSEIELAELPSHRFVDCQRVGRAANAQLLRAWDTHLQRAVTLKVARSGGGVEAERSRNAGEEGIRAGMRRVVEALGAPREVGRYTLLREARLLAGLDAGLPASVGRGERLAVWALARA